MKNLILIRHAKSSWEQELPDIQRPLSVRGKSDAHLLSNEFVKHNYTPEVIFSSPANRAMSTCKVFMENCNYGSHLLNINDELYDFGGSQVIDFIRHIDDRYKTVMIFGHNHAFTSVVNRFGDKFIENVPTCGLTILEFNTDSWKNIDEGHTKMTLFPRDLK